MEETINTIGSNDSGRYDNDFEKLPRDEEEVNAPTEHLAATDSPGGDATNIESATVGDEPAPSPSKSQLNVEDISTTMPQTATSDEEGDKGGICAGCCFVTKTIDPRVKDILLWRDVKISGAVFGSTLVVFLSFALCSIISVISYLSLAVLTMTASFRIYHVVMATAKKTEATNPFRKYLEMDINIPEDMARQYGDIVAKHLTIVADRYRRLFFVDNIIKTLKFALLLWLLTYVGGWFNGITLIIIGDILLFTVPKVYEMHQSKIDDAAKMMCAKLQHVWKQAEEKLPVLGKLKQA